MIADIIIISIIALFVIIGIARGMAKSLLSLAGIVVTAISAYYLSKYCSEYIYDMFVKDNIIRNLEQTIQQYGFEYAANNSIDALPLWIGGMLSGILALFGATASDFNSNIGTTISESAASAIERAVAPSVIMIFWLLLMIIFFIVIYIIVKKLIKLVLKVFEIPIIKQINKLLGGVLGAVEGLVVVWFAVNIFYTVASISNPELFAELYITGELFKFFCIAI